MSVCGFAGGGGPIMGDLWALKGLFDEGTACCADLERIEMHIYEMITIVYDNNEA